MSEQVGSIHFDVTLETAGLINGQRKVDAATAKVTDSLNKTGDAATKLGQRFTDAAGRQREANGQFVKTEASVRATGAAMRGASAETEGFNTKLNALTIAVKVLAASFAIVKAAQLADDIRLMAARVEVAAGSFESGSAAMARLIQISKTTQTSVAANVDVFNRLNQSLIQMGGTQNDTLRITELLGKAIKVSGASATEAKGAMLQFGQALGSGKLQGDELRSLMENAPYLMKQLADGIGKPVGALKKLGEEGKLTADVVVNALSKSAAKIEADFAKFPQTVGGAFQLAADAAERANEKFDTLTGSSTALTGAGKGLAEVLDKLAEQFGAANDEAGKLGRNQAVTGWANQTKVVLSYVVDALDVTWQALSVFGRNVAYVFESVGAEIGGIGAQVKAVISGDFAGAVAIRQAMVSDSEKRRSDLDAADSKTLADRKLFGKQMRDAWEQGAGGGRGGVNPEKAPSKLKAPASDGKEAAKLEARAQAAKAYYEGLVADNSFALAKVDAEERKALADNAKRAQLDQANSRTYAMAKVEIQKKFARERAQLEEKTTQEVADLNIAVTSDEVAKIELIRAEAYRRADAAVKIGVITYAEGERAKTLAKSVAEKERAVMVERLAQTNADNAISYVVDEITRIDMAREESFRRTDAQVKAGAISFAQAEADKAKAAIDARNSIGQQVLSINPLAAMEKEYQDKLAIVQFYEDQMAAAGIEGALFVEAKRTELTRQYQAQRQALVEAEFVSQSAANSFLIGSLNTLASTATSSLSGLLTGTMSAAEAMKALGTVVMNEAVGSLVQIGMQYLKNAVIGEATDKALLASKAAGGAMYAASVTAQVAGTSALAAQAAFASTAAIPIIGPGLAPAAAAAAGAAAMALGSPAIATASIAGARQYGGPTEAGKMYRVNETGAPEMFTASNGNQFMLGGQSGSVTPAGGAGGTGFSYSPTFNIDGTADKAAALAQMQRVSAEGSKQMFAQLQRMGVLPQG